MIITLMWAFLSAILIAVVINMPFSFAQERVGNSSTIITKTSTVSYIIIDDGHELVGGFGTVYTITGSSNSLNDSKESAIPIIQDDFDNSPTIGYIRAANVTDIFGGASNNQTQTEAAELPNPFVDQQRINSTIIRELSDSIDSAFGLNLDSI